MMIEENKVNIYILAGVATWTDFMEDFAAELGRRYERADWEVHSHMLFPFGDQKRSIVKQIIEIGYDLSPKLRKNFSYKRGLKVAAYIKEFHKGGRTVIIGHSSGGVAGVHAFNILLGEQITNVQIVQIGSPKCPVRLTHRASALFIYAVNNTGKCIDPITRIGSWGGWDGSKRFPLWNSKKYVPSIILPVYVIGGHTAYFRCRIPYIDENGESNLEKTTNLIWKWLNTPIIIE